MPNLMQRGATFLGGRMKAAAGRSVSIRQGAGPPVTGLTGWVSLVKYEVVDAEGILTSVKSHDWSFLKTDLGTFEFRSGDEITDVDTGDKYEVLPIDKRPCVEDLDSSGILLTVHCPLVHRA